MKNIIPLPPDQSSRDEADEECVFWVPVWRNANKGREERRKLARQLRRLRQLEFVVNIALFGVITFALAAMLGLI